MYNQTVTTRSGLLITTTLFASLITYPVYSSKAAGSNLDPKALAEIDTVFEEHIEDQQVSGLVALIAKDGEVGYYKSFGMSDIENNQPMSKDAIFRIYSMSKPIVSAVAMSLWEEGKFKLDDPISEHLPEWADVEVSSGAKRVAIDSPITPRQLMTHSSGLSYRAALMTMRKDLTLKQFSEELAKRPLEFQPGTQYLYGLSIDILGRYIEAIEGKPLNDVIRERLLDPLGMKSTDFWVRDAADHNRLVHIYNRGTDGVLKKGIGFGGGGLTKPNMMLGGQGMVSTTEDYGRFCQMLINGGEFNGKRVFNESTVDEMFKNHLENIGGVYGLGGTVGDDVYSWSGAAGTHFWVDRKNSYYAVFMIQALGYNPPTKDAFRRLATKAATKGHSTR